MEPKSERENHDVGDSQRRKPNKLNKSLNRRPTALFDDTMTADET
jgi:hypothetical protein